MISIQISANTSPLAGKEGTIISGGKIKDRLVKESENDVALKINVAGASSRSGANAYELQGRGDLHLGILIEKMRREGFEMSVTPPSVVMKKEGNKQYEPIEVVNIEIAHEYIAGVIDTMNDRKGILVTSEEIDKTKQR